MKSPISEVFHKARKTFNCINFDSRRAIFTSRANRDGFVEAMKAAGYKGTLKTFNAGKRSV